MYMCRFFWVSVEIYIFDCLKLWWPSSWRGQTVSVCTKKDKIKICLNQPRLLHSPYNPSYYIESPQPRLLIKLLSPKPKLYYIESPQPSLLHSPHNQSYYIESPQPSTQLPVMNQEYVWYMYQNTSTCTWSCGTATNYIYLNPFPTSSDYSVLPYYPYLTLGSLRKFKWNEAQFFYLQVTFWKFKYCTFWYIYI